MELRFLYSLQCIQNPNNSRVLVCSLLAAMCSSRQALEVSEEWKHNVVPFPGINHLVVMVR